MPKSEPAIQKFMTQQPLFIEAKESVEAAQDMLSKYGIRHLPVMRDGELVGILSEREINLACNIDTIDPRQLLVIDICSEDPYVVDPETPLREVVAVMASKHYGSAVVMQNDKLVGIFTTVDACRALSQLIESDIVQANLKRINFFRHPVK